MKEILKPEEKDLKYTLGNIIRSNHIQLEKRIKMIMEVIEIHGYTQLAGQVCPECNGIRKLRAIDFGYPASDADWFCPTCQGTGKPDKGKILLLLINQCQTHEHRGCDCSPEMAEGCWGFLADQILDLFPVPKLPDRENIEDSLLLMTSVYRAYIKDGINLEEFQLFWDWIADQIFDLIGGEGE